MWNWKISVKALTKQLWKLTIKAKRLLRLKFLSFVNVNDSKETPNKAKVLSIFFLRTTHETTWAPTMWAVSLLRQERSAGRYNPEAAVFVNLINAFEYLEISNRRILNHGWVNFPFGNWFLLIISFTFFHCFHVGKPLYKDEFIITFFVDTFLSVAWAFAKLWFFFICLKFRSLLSRIKKMIFYIQIFFFLQRTLKSSHFLSTLTFTHISLEDNFWNQKKRTDFLQGTN